MTSREVLTIQLGHYSNFIGTHWWNLQRQTTYTPRLLLVDLKGTLGHLKEDGDLYGDAYQEDTSAILWNSENVEITREETAIKTPFVESLEEQPNAVAEPKSFDLENDVNTWVDYLVPRFHPRTVTVINEYQHNSTSHPFNIFTYGRNLWNTEQFSENFADKIRIYTEECDFMQGFQVILDSTDAFAGLGASCVQHLRDEYGKSILSFPCIDNRNSEASVSDLIKTINTALCWQHIGDSTSLYSPLCTGETGWPRSGDPRTFNHLTYNSELKYHNSVLLATALDTLTIRYRRKEYPNVVLSDLCADLNKLGRRAAATSLSLPFPMTAKMDLIDVLDDFEGTLWTSLTPSCNIPMDKNMQSIALRGIPEDRLKRPSQDAIKQISKPAYKCSSVHEMMTLYLACTCHASATYLSTIKSGLLIKDPYPKIFNNNVAEDGNIAGWPLGTDVKSVPVMAGLHSGDSLAAMYESLHKQASRIRSIKKFHAFIDSGLEEDEFKECLNHLLDCKETYEDHYY